MGITTNITGQFGISSFVVSSVPGQAQFTSIQAAIDAAEAAGGGSIYIYPGIYLENLTMPNADISIAASPADVQVIGACVHHATSSIKITGIGFTNSAGNAWIIGNSGFEDSDINSLTVTLPQLMTQLLFAPLQLELPT